MNRAHLTFAALVCAFGAVLTGCNESTPLLIKTPTESVTSAKPVSSETNQEIKLVAVKVTGMMCPHSCLKDVKSLIEKQNDIESIELTKQQNEETIDNPVVLVRYRGILNEEGTTKAILAAGFEKVEFSDNQLFDH